MTPFACMSLASLLISLAASPVLARVEAESRIQFEQAREAMQAKRWADAHQIFLQLWESRRTYDVALHLGQVEYHLRRFRDAATHLAYGLVLLPPREKPEIAERSRALLELCKQEVGTLALSVKNKNATLFIDGKPVADAPLVTDTYVEAGLHQFEVRLDGYTSEHWETSFTKGSQQQRDVQLKPLASTASAGKSRETSGPQDTTMTVQTNRRDESASSTTASAQRGDFVPVIIGSALAIAGLGTGAAFQLLRNKRDDQAESLRSRIEDLAKTSNGCGVSDASAETLRLCSQLQGHNSDYDTYGKLEVASFALAGGALLATSTYFLIARPDRASATQAPAAGLFRVEPRLDRTSAGMLISGSF